MTFLENGVKIVLFLNEINLEAREGMEFIKRSTDYALRSLIYIAGFPKREVVSLGSLANHVDVPPVFLRKLFQKLRKAGILFSHRGVRGGFSLAVSPSEITVNEAVEILQGPIALNQCLGQGNGCDRSETCSFHLKLDLLQKDIKGFFSRCTLKNLADDEKILKKRDKRR